MILKLKGYWSCGLWCPDATYWCAGRQQTGRSPHRCWRRWSWHGRCVHWRRLVWAEPPPSDPWVSAPAPWVPGMEENEGEKKKKQKDTQKKVNNSQADWNTLSIDPDHVCASQGRYLQRGDGSHVLESSLLIFQVVSLRSLVSLAHLPQFNGLIFCRNDRFANHRKMIRRS